MSRGRHARDGRRRRDAVTARLRFLAGRALTWLGGLSRFLPDRPAARLVLLALVALDRAGAPAPAPSGAAQAPRPADPPVGAGAVRAGATPQAPAPHAAAGQDPCPADPPQPAAAAMSPVMARPAAPAPESPPGPGQRPSWAILTSQVAWNAGSGRVEELARWRPVTETAAQPALTRAHLAAYEAYRDKAANQ